MWRTTPPETEATAERTVNSLARKIPLDEWTDALEIWKQNDDFARRVVCCVVCWMPLPDSRNADPMSGAVAFDICEMCLASERQTRKQTGEEQMCFDFAF